MSGDQVAKLASYEALLVERAVALGLVASGDLPRLRTRHLLDSLRAALAVLPTDRDAYDLGSGGGLPGIVVAIACPGLWITLVESRRRRGAFLEMTVERLELSNCRVVVGRVESLEEPADMCFARAFADAATSWRLAVPLLRPGGRLVYFAGEGSDPASYSPEGASCEILWPPPVARAGPLVIMSRQ
ncbi:MAG: class I SAM-dependent methyltransferase [Actinobacteria bacterium]|nr:class I SAM-dependent methyltransferase [Actinomycetota bacterium]